MKKLGFSFVELLIILVIIMIVVLYTVPQQKIFFTKTKTDSISTQLMEAIHLSRTQAMMNNQILKLCGSTNLKTCGNIWNEGYIILSSEKLIYTFQPKINDGFLHWRAFPKGREYLEFLPDGTLNSENGTFWYCENAAINPTFAIVVSQSARARIVYPDATGQIVLDSGPLQC